MFILKNGYVYENGSFHVKDIQVEDGIIVNIAPDVFVSGEVSVFDISNKYVMPGFLDVHVHLREPGFSYKETIETGTKAAARGGYTAVFCMPNVSPVPHNFDNLKLMLNLIESDSVIKVLPYASITVDQLGKELSDLDELSSHVAGFSDDGRGVQDSCMMERALCESKRLGKIIAAHCEDNSLLNGGYIHDGEYAKQHGHKGICSESEWGPIKRDIELLKRTGGKYHVCHISSKESVELIRKAKADGVDITCETAPHYLIFDDLMLQESGNFKMNPPIRSASDRAALIEGLIDGTIDMIATDHAPHSFEEKSKGLGGSNMGVVGLETAFVVMYTHFVKTNLLSMEKLVELFSSVPRKRFGLETEIKVGAPFDACVFDPEPFSKVDSNKFLSKGRSTPFEGMDVFGDIVLTSYNGKTVYSSDFFKNID